MVSEIKLFKVTLNFHLTDARTNDVCYNDSLFFKNVLKIKVVVI